MFKISIITPVYKAEDFLHRCIKSILRQTYTNFELLLINDGSPDNSLSICKQYAKSDSRIKIINQPNLGVSSARNRGLENCSSDFLCFVDSDDYLDRDYLQNFINGIQNEATDLVFQGIRIIKPDGAKELKPTDGYYFYDQVLIGISAINKLPMFGYVCNKLYKTAIIKRQGLLFDTSINLSEDRIFALKYLQYVQSMSVVGKVSYNYIQYPTGLTARQRSYEELKRAADINLECALQLLQQKYVKDFEIDTYRMYISSSLGYISALFKTNNDSFWTKRKHIKAYIKAYTKWWTLYIPDNSYHRLIYRLLKTRNSTFITFALSLYWKLKKIKYNISK